MLPPVMIMLALGRVLLRSGNGGALRTLEKRNPRQHWGWGWGRGAGGAVWRSKVHRGLNLHVSSLLEIGTNSCDGHHSFTFFLGAGTP
jgi:hypothetical protein